VTTTSALIDRPRPRVLFVDRDCGSTQIAANLLRHLSGDRVLVDTAITRPADPSDDRRLTSLALHRADRVVVLGTGLDVARLPGPRYEEWDLTGNDLVRRIQALSDDLTTVPQPPSTMLDRLRALLRAG
jgi:hypothetical protein